MVIRSAVVVESLRDPVEQTDFESAELDDLTDGLSSGFDEE